MAYNGKCAEYSPKYCVGTNASGLSCKDAKDRDDWRPRIKRLTQDDIENVFKELHWLRISYKLAVLTFKIPNTSAPSYLSRHIRTLSGTGSLRSLAVPFLDVPFRCMLVGKRSFSCAVPATWNLLTPADINCDTVSEF